MNLRTVHAVLILLSAILAVLFGIWCLGQYWRQDGAVSLVAAIKGSLVACYFMHLISEKKLIYAVLGLTVVFFGVLMALPVLSYHDGFWIR